MEKPANYTVKKVVIFPDPSRDVTRQTLPGQENLIPGGNDNFFLQCTLSMITFSIALLFVCFMTGYEGTCFRKLFRTYSRVVQ
jgi:hypothetical protein